MSPLPRQRLRKATAGRSLVNRPLRPPRKMPRGSKRNTRKPPENNKNQSRFKRKTTKAPRLMVTSPQRKPASSSSNTRKRPGSNRKPYRNPQQNNARPPRKPTTTQPRTPAIILPKLLTNRLRPIQFPTALNVALACLQVGLSGCGSFQIFLGQHSCYGIWKVPTVARFLEEFPT